MVRRSLSVSTLSEATMKTEQDYLQMINAVAKSQQEMKSPICPRCGKHRMDKQITHNAMSRHADIYVCNICGLDEAIRDMRGETINSSDWFICRQK